MFLQELCACNLLPRSQRLCFILFGVFSAMALALASVGIFSVVAYSVAQRTTEFGVASRLSAHHILSQTFLF